MGESLLNLGCREEKYISGYAQRAGGLRGERAGSARGLCGLRGVSAGLRGDGRALGPESGFPSSKGGGVAKQPVVAFPMGGRDNSRGN